MKKISDVETADYSKECPLCATAVFLPTNRKFAVDAPGE